MTLRGMAGNNLGAPQTQRLLGSTMVHAGGLSVAEHAAIAHFDAVNCRLWYPAVRKKQSGNYAARTRFITNALRCLLRLSGECGKR